MASPYALDFSPMTNALAQYRQGTDVADQYAQYRNALANAGAMPGVTPGMVGLVGALDPGQGVNALFSATNAAQQRDLALRHYQAQEAQARATQAHNAAVLAETARYHSGTLDLARQRMNMLDSRVRARYGLDGEAVSPDAPDVSPMTHGLDENGALKPLRSAPDIGPRMDATPGPQGAVVRPSIAYGLYGATSGPLSGNVQDATTPTGRRAIPGQESLGTADTKESPYIRSSRAGIADPKANALIDANPDRERLSKYLETQRMWGTLRGRPPQGYDYREDGSLNNLKEGTSIKEMKADKEIPTWLKHLEVSRTVLDNASNLERGAAEGLNAIPGVRQFNPFTSVLEAKDLAAHAVQQLVNATRAANHANKVDERNLQWFVPTATDPADLVSFKLSQAQNIFATYMSARARGSASEELSNLIKRGVEASENTAVFQRYKRLTGEKGNATLDASLSKNVEDGPGMAPAAQRSAPRGPQPGRYQYDPATGQMRPL